MLVVGCPDSLVTLPGNSHSNVPRQGIEFTEIQYIKGDFEYLPKLHYVLTAEAQGGRKLELGKDPIYPSEELLGLGRSIAEQSGVRLDLR